jgi:hypothetical protein
MNRTLIALVLGTAACSVQTEAQMHPGTPAFLPADELKVEKAPVAVSEEVFYLIDSSGSNRFREPVGREIMGHAKALPETARFCVIQIASDSQASGTRSWCREPVSTYTCQHPPVKESDFFNTAEQKAYAQAAGRLEQELKTCNDERERTTQTALASANDELEHFLAYLAATTHTDIEGAFKMVEQTSTAKDAVHVIWVWSDMVEDLRRPRKQPLPIDLAGWGVHVRLIRNDGATGADEQEQPWRERFAGWKIAPEQVEWKSFRIGEFGPAPVEGDVAAAPNKRPPAATKPPAPVPVAPPSSDGPSGNVVDETPITLKRPSRGDPASLSGTRRR